MKTKHSLHSNPEAVVSQLLNKDFRKKFEREMKEIEEALSWKRKDAVVTLRLNSRDLAKIKELAAQHGLKYQTFISKILHHLTNQK